MTPRRLREPRTDLFTSVRYYLDESIGEDDREHLQDLLSKGGAQKCPPSNVPDMRFDTQCTHVITGTLEMPEYERFQEQGIHFTKWVTVCYDMNQIHEPRFYSLDPKHIFSGVVVCCDDLPGRDGDHVKAIVAAYGGQFRGPLTRDTTHLVTIKAGSDRYHKAMKHAKRLGMKVVLPHWIYDSLRAAMRVPERPFLFPDPPLFHPEEFDLKKGWKARPSSRKDQIDDGTSDDAPTRTSTTVAFHGDRAEKAAEETWNKYMASIIAEPNNKHGAKKLTKQIQAVFVRPDVDMYPKIFKDCLVYMVPDLEIHAALERCLEERIKAAGGTICRGREFDEAAADDMLHKADFVIAHYRTGWEYWTAWEAGKRIGNIHWLIFCLATGRISGTRDHLLHYPVPRDPIVGFETVVATLTNYTGQERDFLKRLIEIMGGTFDGELRSTMSRAGMPPTTLLVAAQCQGAKVEYAQENEIQIVNHTWLERCFTRWSCISYTAEPDFCAFPTGVHYQERVGRHPLPQADVLQWTQKKTSVADREKWQADHEEKVKELRPLPSPPPRQPTPPAIVHHAAISIEDSEDDNDGSVMNVDSSPATRNLPPPTATLIHSTSTEVEQQLVPETWPKSKPARTIPDSREQPADVEDSPARNATPGPSVAPRTSRLTSEIDPEAVLERGGRAAKAKAAIGVSAQGKDMRTYEEQQRKNKRRSSAATTLEDEMDMLSRDAETGPPSKKRPKAPQSRDADDMDVEEPTSARSKGKAKVSSTRVKLCQTGDRLDDATIKALRKLGVVDAAEDRCTHMCLTKALRNEKVLVAMCRGAHFVSHEWALQSVRAGRMLDAANFPVNEELTAAEHRARTRPPVFQGHSFHITSKKIEPDIETLIRVIKAAGGEVLLHAKKPWPTDQKIIENLHIIAGADDKHLCRTWLKQSPNLDIRIPNYVLDTIKHQDLSYCDDDTLLFKTR